MSVKKKKKRKKRIATVQIHIFRLALAKSIFWFNVIIYNLKAEVSYNLIYKKQVRNKFYEAGEL